jgi:hypothetical protein
MLEHKQVFFKCLETVIFFFVVEIPQIAIQFIVDFRVLKITSIKMFVVRDLNLLG